MSNDNIKTKMTLYVFQFIVGVVCYAFLQVTTGTDLIAFSAAKTNKGFRNTLEDTIPKETIDAMITMATIAQLLIQVSFCFWVVIFLKLITRFLRSFQPTKDGKRSSLELESRFNFEFALHLLAAILYCFLSAFLLMRLSVIGQSKIMWNITIAAVFGLIAGVLHSVYAWLLEREYKKCTSSATSYPPPRAAASA